MNLDKKVLVITSKTIWKGKLMRIPYSDKECDKNDLKTKRIENKTEDRVLIKICLLNK